MAKVILTDGDEGVQLIVKQPKARRTTKPEKAVRHPVHVLYGGADRYNAGTAAKLGQIAGAAFAEFAPDFAQFAAAVGLPESEHLPTDAKQIARLERKLSHQKDDSSTAFAWRVYQRTREKLESEPIEDFRIDFEDGYGFRPNDEEDTDAERAAKELAKAMDDGSITAFSGFRIKSFAPETYGRAVRTLEIFLSTLLEASSGRVPDNFVVTLPKVTDRREVKDLADRLKRFEKKWKLASGSIGIEVVIETPEALFSDKGEFNLRRIASSQKGRIRSAHFGAFDFTSALGIPAAHQGIRHPACTLARQMMLLAFAPLGVRVADSVTTTLPVVLHKGPKLTAEQIDENRRSIHGGWAVHFRNVTASIGEGFYQSWDLHPNQLPARYAANYAFYLGSAKENAKRLRGFIDRATKAHLTGTVFDDAASVRGLIDFWKNGLGCGTFTEDEVEELTGIPAEKIGSMTPAGIAELTTR
ncbi:MAG: phosphoenolpyruvate kinase [Blastocatellia bacterium]|nr:phosphoenolpyruvate kinase [Blastocatellia bacterium]